MKLKCICQRSIILPVQKLSSIYFVTRHLQNTLKQQKYLGTKSLITEEKR